MSVAHEQRNLEELEPPEPALVPGEPVLDEEAAEARGPAEAAPDSFRLYLREIAKYPLLTASQEVALGQRIERGQVKLRYSLAAVPWAVGRVLELADEVRAARRPLGELLGLPEGREPTAAEVRALEAQALRKLRPPLAGHGSAGRPGEPGRQ